MRLQFAIDAEMDISLAEYEGKCATAARALLTKEGQSVRYTRGAILPALLLWAVKHAPPAEVLKLANKGS